MDDSDAKARVRDFWNRASCGEQLYLKGADRQAFQQQRSIRYALEPIPQFANFASFRGKKTLEIGVGLGADHQSLAEAGAELTGVDLTERAVAFTRARLELFGLKSDLRVADAEQLPFPEASFDAIYSWGVIHHSPDTPRAVAEIYRVLQPGGHAKVMIYHTHSVVGYMLWLRYGFAQLRPWRSLRDIYAHHLESPGTKAFSVKESRQLFRDFARVTITTPLTHADLLTSEVGQMHRGVVLAMARRVWPRWFIKRFMAGHGLAMQITLQK